MISKKKSKPHSKTKSYSLLILIFTSVKLYAAPIILPSAPGIESIEIDEKKAIAIADTSYSTHDVHFLQMMILHHEQAIILSKLVPSRTNTENIVDLASRIDSSQEDEILFMNSWLDERGEKSTGFHNHDNKMMNMSGMASDEDIARLEGLDGVEFDRLFLKLMINHHDGAIEMVDELRDQAGTAYDPVLNEFISDLTNDQAIEIERMNGLLINLSDDPRAGLAAGLFTADEAISNMELIASLRKPVGFYDPKNPAMKAAADPDHSLKGSKALETAAELKRHQRVSTEKIEQLINSIDKKFLVEIKPKYQTRKPQPGKIKSAYFKRALLTYETNRRKWSTAFAWCKKRNMTFKILTEDHLKTF